MTAEATLARNPFAYYQDGGMMSQSISVSELASLVAVGRAPIELSALYPGLVSVSAQRMVPLRPVRRQDIVDVYRGRHARGSLDHVHGADRILEQLEGAPNYELAMAVLELPDGAVLSAWLTPDKSACVAAILISPHDDPR